MTLEEGDIFPGIFSHSPVTLHELRYGVVEFIRKLDPAQVFPNINSPALLGLPIEVLKVIGSISGVVYLILDLSRRYKDKKDAGNQEKMKYWPMFIRKIPGSEFTKLLNTGKRDPPAEDDLIKEIENVIKQKEEKGRLIKIKFIKFSSRAHFKDINFLSEHNQKIDHRGIQAEIFFLDFEKRMEEAIEKEVECRKANQEAVNKEIGIGTQYPDYFIPQKDLDYMMNLVRLYFTIRKLEGKRNIDIFFYDAPAPSLRASILPNKMIFSMFQEEWPGVTDTVVSTSNHNYIDAALDELDSFTNLRGPVDMPSTGNAIITRLSLELDTVDPQKEYLPHTWKFVEKAKTYTQTEIYSPGKIITLEQRWSNLISSELQRCAIERYSIKL